MSDTFNKLVAKGSLTFSFAAQWLPNDNFERDSFLYFYAFLRIADDAMDEVNTLDESHIHYEWLEKWLDTIYHKKPSPPIPRTLVVRACENFNELCELVYLTEKKMQWFVNRYNVPKSLIEKILEGFKIDQNFKPLKTTQELENYCDYVASYVGYVLCYIMFFGHSEKIMEVKEPVFAAGRALQLTNIARDIEEDMIEKNRCYIPQEKLGKIGTIELLENDSKRFSDARKWLVEKAFNYYQKAFQGVYKLPHWKYQLAVGTALLSYREIGTLLKQKHYTIDYQRASTPLLTKLYCLFIVGWTIFIYNFTGFQLL